VIRRAIDLIHLGTSPIVQEQNSLLRAVRVVEIDEAPFFLTELKKA
jgi:hypothetical protein